MKLFFIFFKNSLKNVFEFSQDTAFALLDFIISFVITVLMWSGIGSSFSEAIDWNANSFLMLAAFASLYNSFNSFFAGTWELKDSIMSGTLDKYLARPVNVFFATIAEKFQPLELIEGLILFVTVFVYYLLTNKMPAEFVSIKTILSLFVFSCGTISFLCIKSIVSLLSVWLGDISAFQSILFFEDFQFDRYPTAFLGKHLRSVLDWIIPLGLLATYPSMLLTVNLSFTKIITIIGTAFAIGLFWILLFLFVYHRAIKHYESFGG